MPSYAVTKPSWFSAKEEVRENGSVIGELTMLKKLSYALTEARMPGHTVRFGYKGWTARTLFIHDPLGKDLAAVKNLSWWKRDVTVTIDGRDYQWKQKNWWGTRSAWFTSDAREIMEFRMQSWGWGLNIDSPMPMDKTTLLLLFFGIYLRKLQEMDAVAAGA